jgi:Outer membrane lipoprotein-sorting protein
MRLPSRGHGPPRGRRLDQAATRETICPLRSWIRTDTFMPARVEFFGDQLVKVMRVLRAESVAGIPTLLALEMETSDRSHRTAVECDEVTYNTGLDEDFFSTARLSRMGR